MTSIKLAREEDLPLVVDLYVEAVNDMRKRMDLPEPERKHIEAHVLSDFYDAPCFILEDDGVAGFASMCLGYHVWASDPYLTTSMVYVKPEKRKYVILELLYSTIRKYAELQGMPYVDHYVTGGEIDERRKALRSLNLKEHGIIIGF